MKRRLLISSDAETDLLLIWVYHAEKSERSATRIRFRGAGGDDSASAVSAFGTHVDQPVGGLDDVQVVLGHQDLVAGGDQAIASSDQLFDRQRL